MPTMMWPPNYVKHYIWRQQQLIKLRQDPKLLASAYFYYKTRPVEFIANWCDTYNPRLAGTGKSTRMPFILFPRQIQFIRFLKQCLDGGANGLVEKSRDVGATWLCVCFAVWLFIFVNGSSVGFGSRKEMLVDRIGDMDSIFEKLRFVLRSLPREFLPYGFGEAQMSFMKIVSGYNNTSITGESGDDIGRGGRKLIYFKDESAHYEHPESIEAALSDNARVQIDISSVHGLGNVFHRKRESGVEWTGQIVKDRLNVFVLDWSDHPEKTRSWYNQRQADAERTGLLHLFYQEIDRNYSASVEGVIIPAEWVKSAIDAHLKIEGMYDGPVIAGLDVADAGGDRNALSVRRGSVLVALAEWGERDTGVTTRRTLQGVAGFGKVSIQYDCIGVGAGIKAEANRLKDDELMPKRISFVPWNAGAAVQDPDKHVEPDDRQTPINKDFYANLKAQGWWQLRRRFEKTHRAITEGILFPPDELISLDSKLPLLRSLQKELSQPTAKMSTRMKLMVDKAPEGSRSPNLGDAVMQAFYPVIEHSYDSSLDWVGEMPKEASPLRSYAQDAWSRGMVP